MMMIDYIVLAEFDINEGSIIRHQHPTAIKGVDAEAIAAYMLPEGGHNRSADSTYFILNRKKVKDLFAEQQKILVGDSSGSSSQGHGQGGHSSSSSSLFQRIMSP